VKKVTEYTDVQSALINNFSIVFGGGKHLFIVLALLLPFLLKLGHLIS